MIEVRVLWSNIEVIMSIARIISEGYPHADASIADEIMWQRTAYPFIEPSAKELYKTANLLYRATCNNIALCEFCNTKVYKNDLCKVHYKLLNGS